ncbi:hypothetical protein [Rubrobacter calidifluminis]|uniref:hypothetical protein n=1 Tax=Rubrobacter calidifluminis TaxID=1392640 RepID=UPI0023607EF1|nr:hypothetical protein [Rubrobacter calidifluminis]
MTGGMSRPGESEAGRRMEEEFYRRLAEVVEGWEEAFASLDLEEQRRVVASAAESGLLQAIQMARAALRNHENRKTGGRREHGRENV